MNPLVQPDPGLFIWTIVTFLVLLALLAKFAWRPLLDALDRRQQEIRKSLDDAQRARHELEQIQHESQRILAAARTDAESIVARTRSDAERQIELETSRALQQIRQEAVDLSVAIASKLIQRNLSKEDNERLINEAISQIGRQDSPPRH